MRNLEVILVMRTTRRRTRSDSVVWMVFILIEKSLTMVLLIMKEWHYGEFELRSWGQLLCLLYKTDNS